MTPLLWGLTALGLAGFLGRLAMGAAFGSLRGMPWPERAAFSMALGPLVIWAWEMAAVLLGFRPGPPWFVLAAAGMVLGFLAWKRESRLSAVEQETGPMTLGEKLLVALIASQVLFAILEAAWKPLVGWDSWAIWGFKAKVLMSGEGFPLSFFGNRQAYDFAHLDYPVLVPVFASWPLRWAGMYQENLAKIVHPYWFITLLLGAYAHIRKVQPRPWTLFLTALLATTPIVLDHANIGNANLACGVYLCLGAGVLWEAMAGGELYRGLLAGMLLGGATQCRPEGLMLVVFLVGCMAAGALLERPRRMLQQVLLFGVVGLTVGTVVTPWRAFVKGIGLVDLGTAYLGERPVPYFFRKIWTFSDQLVEALRMYLHVMLWSPINSASGSLEAKWGLLWLLLGILLLAGFRFVRRPPVVSWVVFAALTVVFYAALWVIPAMGGKYKSFDRYILPPGMLIPWILAHALKRHPSPDSLGAQPQGPKKSGPPP